ncbi:MAG: hypothetical protein F6J93_28530 [Oscillatoria sp. SIO1A7]|nr:hypothetical protein [Oscillatoria sp. SIO1A7]
MKRGKMLTYKKALLSGGLAIASTVLATMPALAQQSKSFNLTDKTNEGAGNYPTVTVTVTEAGSNKVTVDVQVNDGPTGYIGDLSAVWFDLPSPGDVTVTGVSGGPVTALSGASNADNDNKIGNHAKLNGGGLSFNLGVQIGVQGIANDDDYQAASFTLEGVSLSDFTSGDAIGSRLQSVGDPDGSRDDSSKSAGSDTDYGTSSGGDTSGGDTSDSGDTSDGGSTGGGSTGGGDTGGGIADAEQVPEPMSIVGWLVGGGAIAAWRRRNKKRA